MSIKRFSCMWNKLDLNPETKMKYKGRTKKIHFLRLSVQVLLEQTPKLHLFYPRESTLLVSVAGDESIVGDSCPESAYIHPSQHND